MSGTDQTPLTLAGLAKVSSEKIEEVKVCMAELVNAEGSITRGLQSLSEKYHGHLEGLEHKFKLLPRVVDKLQRQPGTQVPRDLLRYTMVFPDEHYVCSCYNVYEDLQQKYKTYPEWIKQRWDVGDGYQGINTSWELPSGAAFELQMHTKASFNAKEKVHRTYETFQQQESSSAQESLLNQMVEEEEQVPNPVPEELRDKGLESWKTYCSRGDNAVQYRSTQGDDCAAREA